MNPAAVRVMAAVGVGLVFASAVRAQDLRVTASRWFSTPKVADYRVGISRTSLGPITLFPAAQIATADSGIALAGVGIDAIVRPWGSWSGYLVGGISGGFLDFDRSAGFGLWRSWSVGVGAEVLQLGPLGAAALETRYQSLDRVAAVRGISLGVRLGAGLRRRATAGPSRLAGRAALEAADYAMEAMGTPYQWGGTGGNGFDCSGLIQFAYRRAGMALPRRSVDQATSGREVGRALAELQAGDILVFSATPGGAISHVGLYLGRGRFIHSASRGVRISGLSAEDPDGQWWFQRWTSTRRLNE